MKTAVIFLFVGFLALVVSMPMNTSESNDSDKDIASTGSVSIEEKSETNQFTSRIPEEVVDHQEDAITEIATTETVTTEATTTETTATDDDVAIQNVANANVEPAVAHPWSPENVLINWAGK